MALLFLKMSLLAFKQFCWKSSKQESMSLFNIKELLSRPPEITKPRNDQVEPQFRDAEKPGTESEPLIDKENKPSS